MAARTALSIARDHSIAQLLGAAIAALILPAVIAGLVAIKSRRAALITFIVVALLGCLGFIVSALPELDDNPATEQSGARSEDREPTSDEPGATGAAGTEADIDVGQFTLQQIEEAGIPEVSEQEAACIFAAIEGRTTIDEILNDPAADEGRRIFTQAGLDCADDPAGSQAVADALANNLELGADGQIEVDAVERRCLLSHILDNSDDPARTIAVADRAEDVEVLLAGIERCLSEQDVAIFRGDEGAGPQDYGDNDRLDLLFDDCQSGDGRACDILYEIASVDSEYFDVAFDCAGRAPSENGWCTLGVGRDLDGLTPADDPGLLALGDDCIAGDFTACDLVYLIAPFGSEIEQVGFSCGGRIASGALPDCRTRFG